MANAMAPSIDDLMKQAQSEITSAESPPDMPSMDALMRQSEIDLGIRKKSAGETISHTVTSAFGNALKIVPSLWEQLGYTTQDIIRQYKFLTFETDTNPVGVGAGMIVPKIFWPKEAKEDYENYIKDHPIDAEIADSLTRTIFSSPAEAIRKEIDEYYYLHPDETPEQMNGFVDSLLNPRKVVAAAGESIPLMVGAGIALHAGQAPLAFTLMFGAEGNDIYESSKANGATEEQARNLYNVYGMAAAAIEMFQIDQWLKLGGAQKKALTALMGAKIANKTGGGKKMSSLTAKWLMNQAAESLEEMSQGTTQELLERYVTGKPIEQGFIGRRLEESLVTMALGLPFLPGAAAIDVAGGYHKRSVSDVVGDAKVMADLEKDLTLEPDDYAIPKMLFKKHINIENILSKLFGKKVVWFSPRTGSSPANDFDGWAHPTDPSIILLNADSPNPLAAAGFHEALHQLKVENPEGYTELKNIVFDNLRSKAYLFEEIRGKFARVGYGDLDDALIEEEVVADVIGRLAIDETFIDSATGSSPSMMAQFGRQLRTIAESLRKQIAGGKVVAKEKEAGYEWIDSYIKDLDSISAMISSSINRITTTMQAAQDLAKQQKEAEKGQPEPQPQIPVKAAEKKDYTTIPKEWHPVKTLQDWGKKGLRIKDGTSVKGRKFFNPAWLGQFSKLPTRLPRETLKYLRSKTDEVFNVENKNGESYYLVPTKALEEARAELPAEAFVRGEKNEVRTAKQQINDTINALENRNVPPEEVGKIVEGMANELNVPVEELGDRAYELVYKGRGQEVPTVETHGAELYRNLVEASKNPEMTKEKFDELKAKLNEMDEAEQLKKEKRRLGKRDKAKVALAPTYEEVSQEIDKYRPEAMARRALAERERRESGEALRKPGEEPTQATRQAGQLKGEASKMLAERKPKIVTMQYAAGKFIYFEGAGRKLSNRTIENRRDALKKFNVFLESHGITDLQDVTPEMIRQYIRGLVNRGLKASSINNNMTLIKGMFDLLKQDGDIGLTPWDAGTIETLKEGKVAKKTVSRETVEKVVASIGDAPDSIRDIALIRVLFDTGLRVSEVVDIVNENAKPGDIVKYVKGKGGKERGVLITKKALEALERYVNEVRPTIPNAANTNAVFLTSSGKPMSRYDIRRVIVKWFGANGVKLTTHNLRASFATDMIENGMDLETLRVLMGHANLETTANYLNLSMAHKRAAAMKLPKPSISKKSRLPRSHALISEGKTEAVDLRKDLIPSEKFPIRNGWILEDGSIFPVKFQGKGVIFSSHYDDARRIGYTPLQLFRLGVVRLSAYQGTIFNEISVEGYLGKMNDKQMESIRRFVRSMTVVGMPNELFFKLHADNSRGGYSSSEFSTRSEVNFAIKDALDTATKMIQGTRPKPSISKKSRRVYRKENPKNTILDTAERAAGKRAQAHTVEMTKEELLKVKLRAQRDAARDGYRQGLLTAKQKLNELKTQIKKKSVLQKEFRKFVQSTLPMALRGRMLTALEKTKNEKTFEAALNRLYTEIENAQRRQELASLKKFIRAFNKRYGYKRKGLYKTGGKYKMLPEFSSLFEKIFDRITTKKPLTDIEKAGLEDLLELAKTEREAAEQQARESGEDPDSPFVRYEIDKVIEALNREMRRIPVQKWTADQIRAFKDGMIALVAAYEWQRNEYKEAWDLDRNSDISYAIAEVQSSWKKPIVQQSRDVQNATSQYHVRNIWSWIRGLVGRHNYNLQTLVQIVTGARKGKLFERLVQDIQAGVDDQKYEMFYMQDMLRTMMDDANITWEDLMEWSRLARVRGVKLSAKAEAFLEKNIPEPLRPFVTRKDVKPISVRLESGTTLDMSVMEAIDILMHTRNEFNYNALKNEGAVFRDRPYAVMKLTDNDLESIRKAVPEKALKLVPIMDTLIRVQQERINKISRKIDGFDIANIDGYWHIRRLIDRGVRGKQAKYTYETIEGRSNWKQRTGSKNPVVLGDAFNNLIESFSVGAEYIGMAEPIRNARFISKNRTLKRNIVERGYGDYWSDIIKQIDRLQEKQNIQEWYESLYASLARGVTRAVFGFNLRVSAQQYASVYLAASELGFPALKYIRAHSDASLLARIADWSPMLRERFLGAIGRELGDVAKVGSVMRFLTGKDQLINVPMAMVRFFDRMAIMDVWRMAEGTVAEEYAAKYGGVTLKELLADAALPVSQRKYKRFKWDVIRRAEETVRATQPTWDVVDRSVIGSSKNPLTRAFTMFHSQREKLAQMIGLANSRMMNDLNRVRIQYGLSSLREAAKTKEGMNAIRKMAQTYGIVLTNTAFVKAWALLYGIVLFKRDEDVEDWAWAVVADVPGMYYFGDLPRDVIVSWGKRIRGKRVYELGAYEQAPIRVITTARQAAYEMGNLVLMSTGAIRSNRQQREEQLLKTLDKTWESANYAFGLPFMHGTDILQAQTKKKTKGKKPKTYKR